jgi:hypothetical protein
VRALADGRRAPGDVWTVRRGLDPDNSSRKGGPMRSRRRRALVVAASVLLAVLAIL